MSSCSACMKVAKPMERIICAKCNTVFHFACVNIASAQFKKLSKEARSKWTCPECRPARSLVSDSTPVRSSLNASTDDEPVASPRDEDDAASSAGGIGEGPVSLETIFLEIRDMKRQFAGLMMAIEDVKVMKTELADLKLSCEFNHSKLDQFERRLEVLEDQIPVIKSLQTALSQPNVELMN